MSRGLDRRRARGAVIDEIRDARRRRGRPDPQRRLRTQLEEQARTEAPQGVLAFAAPIPNHDVDDLLGARTRSSWCSTASPIPATSARSCGPPRPPASPAWCCPATAAPGSRPTAVKAAAGAVEYLPIAPWPASRRCSTRPRGPGCGPSVSTATGPPTSSTSRSPTRPLVVVLGAEGRGLARLTRERCDVWRDPDARRGSESLNVVGRGRGRLSRDRAPAPRGRRRTRR